MAPGAHESRGLSLEQDSRGLRGLASVRRPRPLGDWPELPSGSVSGAGPSRAARGPRSPAHEAPPVSGALPASGFPQPPLVPSPLSLPAVLSLQTELGRHFLLGPLTFEYNHIRQTAQTHTVGGEGLRSARPSWALACSRSAPWRRRPAARAGCTTEYKVLSVSRDVGAAD